MGSPISELDHQDDESPQHIVTVPDFFLGKYPVTQAQWRAICGLPPVNPELVLNSEPSRFPADFRDGETFTSADQRPVEQVNWYESTEACARLAQATRRPYSLPSEAQWEYACRAGSITSFHFGETLSSEVANYRASVKYGRGTEGLYRQETTPVGYFPPNAWGLHDMHGNIREWCVDHWHPNYRGAPTDGSAWVTSLARNNTQLQRGRLLRGGSWISSPRYCRSAVRYRATPDYRFNPVGFRVCCAVAWTS
ncbi:MAG: formylglycine-generating enzyme family protein [Cyanobacteria bacterium]|nr:formylglycine-generating enzyme family protein [Cyanobacteriota bacterium]